MCRSTYFVTFDSLDLEETERERERGRWREEGGGRREVGGGREREERSERGKEKGGRVSELEQHKRTTDRWTSKALGTEWTS